MTNIYLVRHGDKIKNTGDVGLTDLGKRQARITGNFLKEISFDKIISSPLKRTLETANIISDILKKPYHIDERLKERFNYGDIPGQTYREFLLLCQKSVEDRDYKLPNGRSSRSAGLELERVIKECIKLAFKQILIISHGGIIGDYIRNVFTEIDIREKSTSFLEKLQVDHCSITQVRINNGTSTLISLDKTTHLKTM